MALIYTSILVGVSTYIIVFHLNSLVQQTSAAYTPIRSEIIYRMRNHDNDHWASKGKQFATFQPKHERLKPSEWWILLFWIQDLFTSLYRFLLRKPELGHTDTGPSPEVLIIGDHDESAMEATEKYLPTKSSTSIQAVTLPPETSQRNPFHFQMRFLKKHNSSLAHSSANPPIHEEV